MVWALPISLVTTEGISIDFSSCAYLDISVRRVPPYSPMYSVSGIQFKIGLVTPFGNLWIKVSWQLPRAYRTPSASFFGTFDLGIHRLPYC